MSITLSQQAFGDLFQETVEPRQHPDPDDALDVMYKYPALVGQGYWRVIQLREGLELTIGDLRLHDRMITTHPEQERDWLRYHFHFLGAHGDQYTPIDQQQYFLTGTGSTDRRTVVCLGQPFLEVDLAFKPELLKSFAADRDGQLPAALQGLIQSADQLFYHRCGSATLAMQRVAQQILKCPYVGIAKRIYLEGAALTLIGMLVAQEIEIWDGTYKTHSLKPEMVDRIHAARNILLQQLDNPPSLTDLAQRVGLNSRSLKEGFREVFGQPTFRYLHEHRLEQARQLLETQDMKVTEIAQAVGFGDRGYFARAFRKKFGCNPKDYQLQRKLFF